MLLAAAATLVGASVQSATGFGFALVLGPALFAVLDPHEAVTALLALGLVLNLLVLADAAGAGAPPRRPLATMLVAAVPGLAVGAALLAVASKPALQVAVGVSVVVAAAVQAFAAPAPEPRPASLPAALAVGLASGTLTTSTSVSGPPIVLWLERQGLSPADFRAALAWSFLALNASGWAVVLLAGGGDVAGAGTLLPLAALVIAGHVLGALAFRRLNPRRFRAAVLALVFAAGVASVAAGLAAL